MKMILNQFIGFLIGVLSSWAFWYLQMRSKPKIAISPWVAYNPCKNTLAVKIRNEKGCRLQIFKPASPVS
jgi:hypothetical protein